MKNRKTFITTLLMCLLVSMETSGQIMEWTIQPSYKDIVYLGKDLYKVKGTNGKWGIYNTSNSELTVPVEYDNIGPLVDDRCLILDGQGVGLYGIIDEQGNPVGPLISASQRPSMVVMKDYPYYSDGLLVVGQPSGQYYNYGYVDKQGNPRGSFQYLYACPFDHGQAMVRTKKGAYQIIDKQGAFHYQGNDRINFMSNPQNGVFVLVTDNNRISKTRLERSKFNRIDDIEKGRVVVVSDAISTKSIYSKGGKSYFFDNAFHYVEGDASSVVSPVKSTTESNGMLKKQKGNGLYSINYDNAEVLPAQFKNVKIYDDEYAVVTLENNSVGLLKYNPSGEISIKASSATLEFTHHQESFIPVDLTCKNLMKRPMVEITVIGDSQNRTFNCQGSGRIEIPFYEPHSQSGKTTSKTIAIEKTMDKLKLGKEEISITSSHRAGFTVSIGNFPAYSNKNGSATVNVTISSVGGEPSESAVAVVNGTKHYFNGKSQISVPVHFPIPTGQIKNCSVNVTVTEDGCPSISSSKSGSIKSIILL